MRVAFFGTSDRSEPILEALIANFDLVLCITKEDTKVGRNHELKETGVKKWAKKHNIKYVCIPNLKDVSEQSVIEQLSVSNVDISLVSDFSFLIPPKIFNEPKFKTINIHFSLLPKRRGASPVQDFILSGENTTGMTFLLVDTKLDSGNIISQYEYKITDNVTSDVLYKLLFEFAAQKLPEVLHRYTEGLLIPYPQDEKQATYTYSKSHPNNTYIYKEDAEINWSKPIELIEREIRAYYPWPISWTRLGLLADNPKIKGAENTSLKDEWKKDLTVKIYKAETSSDNNKTNENNTDLAQNKSEHKLEIGIIQVEGSKKITWNEFVNGYLVKES